MRHALAARFDHPARPIFVHCTQSFSETLNLKVDNYVDK